MNNPIAISGLAEKIEVSLIPEAHKQKAEALGVAQEITTVHDEISAALATDAEKELKRIAGEVEKARQAIKKPVLDLGRAIDDKAKQFVASLDSEAARINRLRLKYASDLEEARQAEIRQREEAERLEREAIAAKERAAAEALKAAESLRGKKAEEAKADAERLRWEAERAAIEADQKEQEQPLAIETSAGTLRVQWDYEVVDSEAFVCAYPKFCKIDIKRREFLEAINGDFFTKSRFPEEIPLSPNMPPRPPGIRVFKSEKIR